VNVGEAYIRLAAMEGMSALDYGQATRNAREVDADPIGFAQWLGDESVVIFGVEADSTLAKRAGRLTLVAYHDDFLLLCETEQGRITTFRPQDVTYILTAKGTVPA